jgi:hypothetical protein
LEPSYSWRTRTRAEFEEEFVKWSRNEKRRMEMRDKEAVFARVTGVQHQARSGRNQFCSVGTESKGEIWQKEQLFYWTNSGTKEA